MTDRSVPLDTLLTRWVADGLVSADQATAIREVEEYAGVSVRVADGDTAGTTDAPRWPLVVEALGYLGGVVTLVAAGLVTAQFWADLPTAGRVALAGAATLLLIVAGLRVPLGPGTLLSDAGRRLCAVLLGLGVAGTAASLGLAAADVLDLQGESVGLLTASGTALVAGVLAWRRPSVVQQVATAVPLAVAAGVFAARLGAGSFGVGLAIWAVGPAWYALGSLRLFGPRQADAPLAAALCVAGSVVATSTDAGIALALATVVALVVLALAWRDLLILGIAALAAFLVLPPAVSTWFPGSLAAPVALLVVGVGLVAVAIVMARGRGVRRSG